MNERDYSKYLWRFCWFSDNSWSHFQFIPQKVINFEIKLSDKSGKYNNKWKSNSDSSFQTMRYHEVSSAFVLAHNYDI